VVAPPASDNVLLESSELSWTLASPCEEEASVGSMQDEREQQPNT
jgi:hypothetical protein